MNVNEKVYLIELLLKDIRGNWGWENGNRIGLAVKLCGELTESVENIKELQSTIVNYNGEDGRYFRQAYPQGYENMGELYKTSKTYNDKSDEFKKLVKGYITYPDYIFEDVDNLEVSE